MERCPTCRARYQGGLCCHRCQTDFRLVLAAEGAAVSCQRQARAAFERGCSSQASTCANRACALHRSIDSLKMQALIALGEGDFVLALRLWREIRQDGWSEESTA